LNSIDEYDDIKEKDKIGHKIAISLDKNEKY